MGQRSTKAQVTLLAHQYDDHSEEEIIPIVQSHSLCIERLERLESQVSNLEYILSENQHQRSLLNDDNNLSSLNKELCAAKERADKWERAYNDLHKRHEDYLESIAKESDKPPTSVISTGAISRFVDELLADPNINIYYLPDTIEKPLYTNILKIVLSLVQKSLNHTNLDIIGHEFKMSMRPTAETVELDEDKV